MKNGASERLPYEYEDLPWLTNERLKDLLEEAYELGSDRHRWYAPEDGGVDWDGVMNRLEMGLDTRWSLPLTYEHPLMNRIKRAYRQGQRENN